MKKQKTKKPTKKACEKDRETLEEVNGTGK